jgi:putative ABC transport system permease protein
MTFFSFVGALEIGFIYALVALGTFISFRILNFPDLTVDGSFPLGAAVAGVMIINGMNPWLSCLCAFFAGAVAGAVTAFLNIKLSILHILASILTMIALYSINLRIMGRPNIALFGENTILTFFDERGFELWAGKFILAMMITLIMAGTVIFFLNSQWGLALRATGSNPRMARAQGISTKKTVVIGLALSNGLVALGGSVFAQLAGFADVTLGVGTIIAGLAAVIVGEALWKRPGILNAVISCIIGSVIYRLAIAWALGIDGLGLNASDLNLMTAILVTIALFLSTHHFTFFRKKKIND